MKLFTKSFVNLENLFKTWKSRKKIIEKNIIDIKKLINKKITSLCIFENKNLRLNKIDKFIYSFIYS